MAIRHVATIAIKDRTIQIRMLGKYVRVKLLYKHTRFSSWGMILENLISISGAIGEEPNLSGEGIRELLLQDRPEMNARLRNLLAGEKMRRLLEKQEQEPVLPPFYELTWSTLSMILERKDEKQEWLYRGRIYQASQLYTPEEVKLLIWEKTEKERRKFERLRKQMEAGGAIYEARRERIPEDVRTFVWRRDGGQCVGCGSTQSLEFDHIIAVSKGGSNTAKNVQLLCAECNRKKSDHI